MLFSETAPGLDDLLLDTVTVIELSDHDREVADNRYGRLKPHLERTTSPLRPYLMSSASLIYAQGSMAIGATIVSGTDDDRFDVDALVDMPVPSHWSDDDVLDQLFDALQGFPDVREIVRCTRCVQMRFAFMHMDVTILDPARAPRAERVGEIFHSPDHGNGYRVPSNPYGFAAWYRQSVVYPSREFLDDIRHRRRSFGVNRLPDLSIFAKADQENLPPVIPERVDAQQVYALKLMKRFLNLRYEDRDIKRPPSIYLTKLSATCGYDPRGLTAQLERFASKIQSEMNAAFLANSGPDERNPSYDPDRLNDRWPNTQADRKTLAGDMAFLIQELQKARYSEIKDMLKIIAELFGERVKERTFETFTKRMDQSTGRRGMSFERGTGTVLPASVIMAPAVSRAAVPSHNFHCEDDKE
ncbi:nucleotidyltransferase [Mesorhizobium sp. XAP10]|uniref:nucleotidyltransferase domain-containing protein n=1 Tax=unclassified Mesorhizobium TaxID=325217 RepID=UPI0023DFA06A|nr:MULTISPECIES: nucleotidyltransferase [unclassified Mesorhizobium]MDF3153250.1 nucleotidyltransferase [Mesorhizobium sp. XAP10]MDF3246452.1 nucleotidyltransferase [Mesorhizobium sp. XAP4]